MIRLRPVLAAVLLVVVGSGCGVGVDAAPRPLEPISTAPRQPAPTVIERPDDPSARCPPSSNPPIPIPIPILIPSTTPTPAPDALPSTSPPTTEVC